MTLPSILITDTNIWIDLENGRILTEIFRLPYQFLTVDFAISELVRPDWNTLEQLGLQSYGLSPESVQEIFVLRPSHQSLSITDLAALLLARTLGATLVSGDRHLNKLARAQGIPVHGVLWILDEMVKHGVLAPNHAANALKQMVNGGARLPVDECRKRYESWS